MNRDLLILWRNILLRSVVVGIGLAILLFLATILLWSTAAGWVQYLFGVDQRALGRIVLQFFLNVRIVLLFFFLAPALALHWTQAKMRG
ncbi:MAG TPA: hypothetical protein VGL24_14080 [Chthoniobacterales bacterium]